MTQEREVIERLLPGYDLEGELGRGAWGIVYAARHRHLSRDVAVKQLPRAFGADPEVKRRFVTEARLLASLDHPHVVPVYDYVEDGGLCLFVLERLSGGTLWTRFSSGGMDVRSACATTLAVCAGLEHAHRHGVLHRDIKPDNILYSASGRPKVADFGIAKVLGDGLGQMTHAGEVLGTPAYMAPEQAQGGALGPATDVYAVAVVLYELLSGRLPFSDEGDALALLWRHVYEAPLDLSVSAPSVPRPIADVVMGALAKAPTERPGSAEQFAALLARAATEAWGFGWLDSTALPVELPQSVLAAMQATTPTLPPPSAFSPVPPPPPTGAASSLGATSPPSGRALPRPVSSGAPRSMPTIIVSKNDVAKSGVETELAAREIAELRNLRRAMSGELGFTGAEIEEFQTVTANRSTAGRLGLPDGTHPSTLRAVAISAIARWRERGEDLFASALVREACETVTRCYEGVYQSLMTETK